MTPGDSLVFDSQQGENEGGSRIVDPSSSPRPLDYQEPLTPSNIGRVSTDFSLGSQTLFNDIGSSGTDPSNTRSVSSSERRSSEAGNEPLETEQFEDIKIQLQPPPQFGKEVQVLCVTELHDIPGEFTMEFHASTPILVKVSLWLRAPEHVHLDFSQARCISLVCYPIQDTGPHAIQHGESCDHRFEILRPVSWKKIPPHVLSFLINDKFTFSFPHEASEHFLDISQYIQLGQNRLCFSQVDSMSEYLLVLYSHYPTESQILPLHARWDERKHFIEQLAWIVRPIPSPTNEW